MMHKTFDELVRLQFDAFQASGKKINDEVLAFTQFDYLLDVLWDAMQGRKTDVTPRDILVDIAALAKRISFDHGYEHAEEKP